MNILVLMKAVPAISGVEDDSAPATAEKILNPADNTALEEALRLKDRLGASVTVMTMGVAACEALLRQQLARGCDRAVLITDAAFAGADTLSTARTLARAVTHTGPYDLILCGRRSTDGETGQIGPELAAMLALPCAANCTQLQTEPDSVRVRCLCDGGEETLLLPLPAVLTVQNGVNSPRLASLSGLFRAKRAEITVLRRAELGLPAELCGQKGSATIVKRSMRRVFEKRQAARFDDTQLSDASAQLTAWMEALT